VTKDVPDHALIVGNPGRLAGWMCACGERVRFESSDGAGACTACGRIYEKAGAKVWPVA
jgi:UDP-2-acetamido-3-amino-2,3-dideoxy-glucuronate N-acetyltransferase